MFKGIKLKTKISTELESKILPLEPQPNQIVEKKWMKKSSDIVVKNEDGASRVAVTQETIEPQDLEKLCEKVWQNFLDNSSDTRHLLKELHTKEQLYFQAIIKSQIDQQRLKFDPSHDVADMLDEEIENNPDPFKKFDSKRSMSVLEDIYKEKQMMMEGEDKQVFDIYKKKPLKFDPDNLFDEEYERDERDPDKKDLKKKKNKKERKQEEKAKHREVLQDKKIKNTLSSCRYCLSNSMLMEEQILSYGNHSFLALPQYKRFNSGHFIIAPLEHINSLTEMDEETYAEIRNFMKCLIAMYDKRDMGCLFFESFLDKKDLPHCVVECIASKRDVDSNLPMYFKKAFEEMDSEWSTHKKIIHIEKSKGGIQKQIPKGFPYFYVDFNLAYGYAHVIENKAKFNKNLPFEIFGTIYDTDKSAILYPKKFTKEEHGALKEIFLEKWDEFDWTKMINK